MDSAPLPDLSDDDRASIYAAMCICFPVAVTTVILRLLARQLTKARLWVDDWLIVFALLCDAGFLICTVILIENGLGRHFQSITLLQLTVFLKTYIPAAVCYATTVSTTKLSILAFYWRIFSAKKSIRLPIYVLSLVVVSWNIAIVAVSIFSCTPVAFWWDKSIPDGHCVDNFAFLLGNSIPNIITDFAILFLPLPFIWGLQQSRGRKFALSGVFLLAGFVCIVTIVRLVIQIKTDFASPDITWNIANFVKWTNVETSLAIVSACLPFLRPLFLYLRHGRPGTTSASQHGQKKFAPAIRLSGTGGTGGTSATSADDFPLVRVEGGAVREAR